jgi:hypothetical protein
MVHLTTPYPHPTPHTPPHPQVYILALLSSRPMRTTTQSENDEEGGSSG